LTGATTLAEPPERTDGEAIALSVILRGVRKRFGPVEALRGADLSLRPGEVHAVLGENGAGKTTLVNVLGGMLRADEGRIEVSGRPVSMASPRDAWALGIGMVHQHFTLVPRLSVLENLALGVRMVAGGFRLPYGEVRERVEKLSRDTRLRIDPDALVEDLPVGARQRVEILKVLFRDPEVLILDEPTAVLAPQEIERLLALLEELADRGRSVVLIAHKLDEVLAVADRVTVLRQGETVLEAPRSAVDAAALAEAMVGEVVVPARRSDEPELGDTVAILRGVSARGARGEQALEGLDLEVRRGEIVGVAGVDGNGQRELAAVLAGRLGVSDGACELPERVGFIPEDRGREALVPSFTLVENLGLGLLGEKAQRSGPFVRWSRIRERTEYLLDRFGVRASGPSTRAGHLSGGNQQKLVVARELERAQDLLVAQNPARGLDVAAEEFVHRELLRLRGMTKTGGVGGPGIVLISTDLDEILALSDRVLVLVRGRIVDMGASRDRAEIGRVMVSGLADRGD
jgi:simple sugar transport system ATP-binding protein